MRGSRNTMRRLASYLGGCELLVTCFCAFIILAAAGYRPRQAAQSVLANFHELAGTGNIRGLSVPGHALVVWLVSTAVLVLATISGVVLVAWGKRASGAVDVYHQADTVAGKFDSYGTSAIQVAVHGPASSIWKGVSIACTLLACASLSLYVASLFGYFFNPVVYSVAFVFAFALGVGSGFGGVSASGASAKKSGGWVGRFKAAPLWMKLAILLTGTVLAFVCVRTGYVALIDPTLYRPAIGIANLAVVGSFLFFVDALAFLPFTCQNK